MTRRDPNAEGESPGSRFGIWLAVVLAFAWVGSLGALIERWPG